MEAWSRRSSFGADLWDASQAHGGRSSNGPISALFALAHTISYPLESLPLPFVFGVIACVLYQRTGSLVPGIALHSLINASAFEKAVTANDLIVFPIYLMLGVLFLAYAGLKRLSRFRGSAVVPSPGSVALSGRDLPEC
jgi:hypothetical protein